MKRSSLSVSSDGFTGQAISVNAFRGGPLLGESAEAARPRPLGGWSKRSFDVAFALAVLILFAPLLLFIALLVKSYDGGPTLFRHKRMGAHESEFACLKFRTMRVDSDEALRRHLAENPTAWAEWRDTRKLKNDPRVTPVGQILRKTSLDELPQIMNILWGDMSVVGPRPIVADEVSLYGSEAARYFRTRPGLTGPWQVSGRSDTSYCERIRLDSHYVDSWSFGRDILIILRTIPAVFLARGSY